MKNTVIIIPTRLGAKRFPKKPLVKINELPMIVHVLNRAKESKVGEVFVATPDQANNHQSGSDRVFEAYQNEIKNKADLIINLQGDMPNIKPSSIANLEKLMRENNSDIGTLASTIKNKNEILDSNIVKVQVSEELKNDNFLNAIDFFRIKKDLVDEKIYHHIGIYAFTNVALTKYVELSRSKLETERNLEQMRAMENKIVIKVGLSNSTPLGVDTEDDLRKITKAMN